MNSVAIIGAGITGLTAAFYLQRKGIHVTVYEASGRVGGVIQSLRQDGYLAEFGPNTLLETSPKIAQLVRDAGLESRRVEPEPKASNRYVVRYRRPIAMPESPFGFFTTKLFSAKAKLAVLREPFVPRRTDGKEESVAEFVLRRLGFDPASGSAPFVATLVDVTGLVIYFSVASVTLQGTLLNLRH